MVEHHVDIVVVGGSIPLVPTTHYPFVFSYVGLFVIIQPAFLRGERLLNMQVREGLPIPSASSRKESVNK